MSINPARIGRYWCLWPSGRIRRFVTVEAFDGYVKQLRALGQVVTYDSFRVCRVSAPAADLFGLSS